MSHSRAVSIPLLGTHWDPEWNIEPRFRTTNEGCTDIVHTLLIIGLSENNGVQIIKRLLDEGFPAYEIVVVYDNDPSFDLDTFRKRFPTSIDHTGGIIVLPELESRYEKPWEKDHSFYTPASACSTAIIACKDDDNSGSLEFVLKHTVELPRLNFDNVIHTYVGENTAPVIDRVFDLYNHLIGVRR